MTAACEIEGTERVVNLVNFSDEHDVDQFTAAEATFHGYSQRYASCDDCVPDTNQYLSMFIPTGLPK